MYRFAQVFMEVFRGERVVWGTVAWWRRLCAFHRILARVVCEEKVSWVIYYPSQVRWDDRIKQRPHHLLGRLASLGEGIVVWLESRGVGFRRAGRVLVGSPRSLLWYGPLPLPCRVRQILYLSSTDVSIPVSVVVRWKVRGGQLVYELIDDLRVTRVNYPGWVWLRVACRHKLLMERGLPDLVVYSAHALRAWVRTSAVDVPVAFIPNGVDTRHFALTAEINSSEGAQPIVGFYGALADWLDWDQIEAVVRAMPDYIFVFVGPVWSKAVRRLQRYGNVEILGPVSYDFLPVVARLFTIGWIPFRSGAIARATSPLKVYEYLSMGLPVVASRSLWMCRGLPGIWFAETAQEYREAIEEAVRWRRVVTRVDRERLREAVKVYDWEVLGRELSGFMGLVVGRGGRKWLNGREL